MGYGVSFKKIQPRHNLFQEKQKKKKDKLSGETEKGQTCVSGKVTQFISNSANFVWGVKQRY